MYGENGVMYQSIFAGKVGKNRFRIGPYCPIVTGNTIMSSNPNRAIRGTLDGKNQVPGQAIFGREVLKLLAIAKPKACVAFCITANPFRVGTPPSDCNP